MKSYKVNRRNFLKTSSLMALAPWQILSGIKEVWGSELFPYLHGIYEPISTETKTPLSLSVIGKIPDEITGSYFRNGPNPYYKDFSKHHWFDGDGMIHKVSLKNGEAFYQNAYVMTHGLEKEIGSGKRRFYGLLEDSFFGQVAKALVNFSKDSEVVKDTSNTDLIYFKNKIISLWWLSGKPYTLDPTTLDTVGIENFQETYNGDMAAHARIDPKTGELFFLDFSQISPYVAVHAVKADGTHHWSREFDDLIFPRVFHDLAFTENYVLLLDFPLGYQKDDSGNRNLALNRNYPSRIVAIDRRTQGRDIKVFHFNPTYVLHAIQCFEKDGKIILTVCKYLDPIVNSTNNRADIPKVGALRIETVFAKWTLNLSTDGFSESILDDTTFEFPRINDQVFGSESSISYCPILRPSEEVIFDSIRKYDNQKGIYQDLPFGKDLVGEEIVFIPKKNSSTEDEGWICTLVHSLTHRGNELRIFDAQSFDPEPVARIEIPKRIPLGFHSKWVDQIT